MNQRTEIWLTENIEGVSNLSEEKNNKKVPVLKVSPANRFELFRSNSYEHIPVWLFLAIYSITITIAFICFGHSKH